MSLPIRVQLLAWRPDAVLGRLSRRLSPPIAVLALCVACSSDAPSADPEASGISDPPTTVAESPEEVLSFRWLESDAVDLMSADGTFLRAAIEAYKHAYIAASPAGGYPGFERTVADADTPFSAFHGLPHTPIIGTMYNKIVSWQQREDGVREAWYCAYGNLVGNRNERAFDGGPPYVVGAGETTRMAWRVEYLAGADSSIGAPPVDQHGPEIEPADDVFGDWKLTSIDTDIAEANSPIGVLCDGQAPGTPPEWPHSTEAQFGEMPPPALEPFPGWPGGAG